MVGLSVERGNKPQHPTIDIGHSFCQHLAAQVFGHDFNIVLQQVYVFENKMIDALQYMIGLVRLLRPDQERVVDQPTAQRHHRHNIPFNPEVFYYLFQLIITHRLRITQLCTLYICYCCLNEYLKPLILSHAPRVKSGIATGAEPFSSEMRVSGPRQHHSAMS